MDSLYANPSGWDQHQQSSQQQLGSPSRPSASSSTIQLIYPEKTKNQAHHSASKVIQAALQYTGSLNVSGYGSLHASEQLFSEIQAVRDPSPNPTSGSLPQPPHNTSMEDPHISMIIHELRSLTTQQSTSTTQIGRKPVSPRAEDDAYFDLLEYNDRLFQAKHDLQEFYDSNPIYGEDDDIAANMALLEEDFKTLIGFASYIEDEEEVPEQLPELLRLILDLVLELHIDFEAVWLDYTPGNVPPHGWNLLENLELKIWHYIVASGQYPTLKDPETEPTDDAEFYEDDSGQHQIDEGNLEEAAPVHQTYSTPAIQTAQIPVIPPQTAQIPVIPPQPRARKPLFPYRNPDTNNPVPMRFLSPGVPPPGTGRTISTSNQLSTVVPVNPCTYSFASFANITPRAIPNVMASASLNSVGLLPIALSTPYNLNQPLGTPLLQPRVSPCNYPLNKLI
jgi:hypothetical protein